MLQSAHMAPENMVVVDADRGRGNMKDAKVAIVVPAYNTERELVDSVRSVLKQTLRVLEAWIVSDGSEGGAAEAAERLMKDGPRIHVIHQPDRGAYRTRLTAFRLLRTPFLEAEPVRSANESLIKHPVKVNRRILDRVRVVYRMVGAVYTVLLARQAVATIAPSGGAIAAI